MTVFLQFVCLVSLSVYKKARELHTLHNLRKLFVQDLSTRVRKVRRLQNSTRKKKQVCGLTACKSALGKTFFVLKHLHCFAWTERRTGV